MKLDERVGRRLTKRPSPADSSLTFAAFFGTHILGAGLGTLCCFFCKDAERQQKRNRTLKEKKWLEERQRHWRERDWMKTLHRARTQPVPLPLCASMWLTFRLPSSSQSRAPPPLYHHALLFSLPSVFRKESRFWEIQVVMLELFWNTMNPRKLRRGTGAHGFDNKHGLSRDLWMTGLRFRRFYLKNKI